MNNAYTFKAIYELYPNVTSIRSDDENNITALDAQGNPVIIDMAAVDAETDKLSCKAIAQQLLANTDWSVLPDVNLINKLDFENYRSAVRALAINPVANPTFPTVPNAQWGA